MAELKNNSNLSKTFSNFEKRIEQDLIVLYQNSGIKKKKIKKLESEIEKIKTVLKRDGHVL